VRVVIADDHEVVRIGLRTILQQSSDGYELVGEAANGGELLGVLAHTPCDAAIVDFQMQGEEGALDGVILLRELRRRHPKLRIVVLTMLRNLAIFRTMYREGAEAVVEKTSMVDELFVALRAVRAGRTYVGKLMREQMADGGGYAIDSPADGKHDQVLSVREAEVVRLLGQGLTVSEIARTTHRSVKTISWQKHSAMTKLGVANDLQLFEYARSNGLL
jgi:two-component system capsular synthesis response regulator RcsB